MCRTLCKAKQCSLSLIVEERAEEKVSTRIAVMESSGKVMISTPLASASSTRASIRSTLYSQSATRTKGTAAATLTNPCFILHCFYRDDMRAAPAEDTRMPSMRPPHAREEDGDYYCPRAATPCCTMAMTSIRFFVMNFTEIARRTTPKNFRRI